MKNRVLSSAAVAAVLWSLTPQARAQDTAGAPDGSSTPPKQAPAETGPDQAGDIVVTGSLIRNLPREYVASPVFTYGKADIAHSGAGSASEYMLTIPQNFTGDISDFGTSAASIGTTLGEGTVYNQFDGFASFALRGLASDATLTLLNGRRMASAGMTESPTVSVIPSALIERIDIISDGSSATYGADAVAGVVNIVTRKPKEGVELRLRGSTTTATGSKNWDGSALAGKNWGSGNAYIMGAYQRRGAFVEAPIDDEGTRLQITQLPNETISNIYGGVSQEVGTLTFSLDASRFQRDRDARIAYIDTPRYDRFFKSRTTGYALYGNMHWQANRATSLDLNIDYGRNTTQSQVFRGVPPYAAANTNYHYRNTLFVAELTGQTELAQLPAGPVIVAGGAQYRSETLLTDAAIFFHRDGGKREAKSAFAEVNLPIIGPEQDVPLIRALSLSAAGRYEDLGFDHAFAPKFGVRWQVDRSIALRGTYARSFLVPRFRDTIGIAEQVSFWNYPYAFLAPGAQNPALPAGNALVMYRAGANPDLRTQKADTFTVGVDLTPVFVPNLTIKAGYYRIRISGRIVTPSPDDSVSSPGLQVFNTVNPSPAQVDSVVNNPDVFRRFVVDVPFISNGDVIFYNSAADVPAALRSQVQVIADIRPQNYAVEKTDGIDLDLTYRARFFGGEASFRLTGQYILDLSLDSGGISVSRLNGYAQPADLRFNGSFVWGRDGFSMGSVVNYVGSFTDNRPEQPRRSVPSYTTASLFFGLDLSRMSSAAALAGVEVQFVIANLFDQRPPRIVDSVLGYDPYNNPPNPRTLGLTISKRFK